MEAKDTVMSNVTPVKLLQNQQELGGLLREQAEVSFRAGVEYALTKEGVKESLDSICRRERQEGGREVAEWVEGNWEIVTQINQFPHIKFDYGKWQAIKEEWRL